MKLCNVCHITLPLHCFHKRAASPDGLAYTCKACNNHRCKKHYQTDPDTYLARSRAQRNDDLDKAKDYDKSYYEKHKEERRRKSRQHYHANRSRYKDLRLQRTYGISLEDYEKMVADQEHRCAICQQYFSGSPHVDHCHATGLVRGLLCNDCNRGLGCFKDNIISLRRAQKYLEQC